MNASLAAHTSDVTTVEKPSFSFDRCYVLSRTRDFDRVYKEGTRVRGKYMTLRVYTGCEATSFKCGFSVRKRDYPRAVDRNKVKRRLREIVRITRPQLLPALWLVIMAHKCIPKAQWADLVDDFHALCGKANCFAS